uniref:Uncharacterized protein n=1 Tax=Aegilops tauschii subsp. strangulata TaxID=200361 RepID=A0A453GFG3_AEGTS
MAEPLKANGNGAAEGGAAGSAFASVKVPPSPPRRLQRFDSLHMEAGKIPGGHSYAAKVCSSLALFLGSTDIFIFLQYISKGTASISIPVMMGTSSVPHKTANKNSQRKITVCTCNITDSTVLSRKAAKSN